MVLRQIICPALRLIFHPSSLELLHTDPEDEGKIYDRAKFPPARGVLYNSVFKNLFFENQLTQKNYF